MEVPSGVQGRSPGGVWGFRPKIQVYTDSLQLSNAFLRWFVAESVLHLPYVPLPPKKLRICANPMTQHGRDGNGPSFVTHDPCDPSHS